MIVEFRDVSVSREGTTLLSGITFSTRDEAVFLVFGESGAGKTSLLRLVNRLDEASSGEIVVGGRPVQEYVPTELRRTVGMIFQEPRLFPGTVADNVMAPLRYHGIGADVDELLRRVGLGGKNGRDVRDLSGGERQRLSIARALSVNPAVLLMDEPTSSLDHAAIIMIEELLLDLVADGRLRVLFVTHDREQLQRLGGRGIVLADGRIVHQGNVIEYIASGQSPGPQRHKENA